MLVPEVPGVIWPDPCPLWHRRSSLDFPRFSFAPIGCEGSSRRSASEPITYHRSISPQLHSGGWPLCWSLASALATRSLLGCATILLICPFVIVSGFPKLKRSIALVCCTRTRQYGVLCALPAGTTIQGYRYFPCNQDNDVEVTALGSLASSRGNI